MAIENGVAQSHSEMVLLIQPENTVCDYVLDRLQLCFSWQGLGTNEAGELWRRPAEREQLDRRDSVLSRREFLHEFQNGFVNTFHGFGLVFYIEFFFDGAIPDNFVGLAVDECQD